VQFHPELLNAYRESPWPALFAALVDAAGEGKRRRR
jgi:hypothetical protein